MSIFELLLVHGGVGVYLILISGIILAVLGAERWITLYRVFSPVTQEAIEGIRGHILSRRYTEAIQICNSKASSPDLSVVKSALLAVENGREAMRSALGSVLLDLNHRCEKRLQYIALIANVATLLGLLGTITGLIKTFAAIANADAAEKAKMLGIGISEAMYATATGLTVGIAAMVIHTICASKSDAIMSHAQDVGFKVMTWIEQSERAKRDAA